MIGQTWNMKNVCTCTFNCIIEKINCIQNSTLYIVQSRSNTGIFITVNILLLEMRMHLDNTSFVSTANVRFVRVRNSEMLMFMPVSKNAPCCGTILNRMQNKMTSLEPHLCITEIDCITPYPSFVNIMELLPLQVVSYASVEYSLCDIIQRSYRWHWFALVWRLLFNRATSSSGDRSFSQPFPSTTASLIFLPDLLM